MQTFLVTFVFLLLVMMALSVGVLMGRKPLKGSCGGVGAALGEKDYICDLCGDDPNKCDEEQKKIAAIKPESLAYDATRKS